MNTFRRHLLKKGSSLREALERLDVLAKDAIIFITDETGKLVGSLTDGDVRRGLLKGVKIDDVVDDILQPNPRFIRKGDFSIEKIIEYRENNFRIIPILDKYNCVINVINFRELKSYLPVDGVIMAGGRGERLRPLTDSMPKPLLKIGGIPIIEHNLNRLSAFGIDDIWISTRYLSEQIESWGGDGHERNISIQYIRENDPLGTLGAVGLIDNFVHETLLVTNSDILTNIDYEHFYLDFIKQNADFSVVTIPYSVDIPYAILETKNTDVLNLREKPTYTYYANGGIYLIRRSMLEYIRRNEVYHATQLMEDLLNAGKKVISYPFFGYWLDIGRHDDYIKAQQDIISVNFK
ncbi:MAG: nucleotidyl transferase [Bacteroidetes bacterium]|nr:MAG: nucleotidyl transferase [Bacteroidota bacterium]